MWSVLLNGIGIYDIGSFIPYTILEVAKLVKDVSGNPIPIEFVDVTDSSNTYYLPKNTRILDELKCKETVSLRDAIKRTIKE
jgi:nucleoside-diphosphate-sugar epimerase